MMPKQKPGRSKQDYETPRAFFDVVERNFGPMVWDLACTRENCKGDAGGYYYPEHDSLRKHWHVLRGNLWLNPPYANIGDWAKKCAENHGEGRRIFLLVPASVGSNWYGSWVEPYSQVHFLNPRISFDGKHPFPKDLMLCIYGKNPSRSQWRWR